jgi:hypothetical protein
MKRDSGQLPVDFLVGFTIFILSLITVANFVPSLLVGLQRTTGIDYDAVAYRTGVVLVEDPGQPAGELHLGVHPVVPPAHPEWDLQTLAEREFVSRFGLAITRDTPNILSISKVERFFNTSFFNDTDYRNKMLFSTYQYGYNITLQNISPMKAGEYPDPKFIRTVGQPYPAGYGYIRRYVVIKQNSDAAINLSTYGMAQGIQYAFIATREDQVDLHYFPPDPTYYPDPHQKFTIRLDKDILYNKSIDTSLKIDLQREPLSIRITNLSSCLNNTAYNLRTGLPGYLANGSDQWAQNNPATGELTAPTTATLTDVDFGTPEIPNLWTNFIHNVNLTTDGVQQTFPLALGVPVQDTIELYLPYMDTYFFNDGSTMVITFTFQNTIPHTLATGTFWYDYNPRNVTQPVLSTGMLEVGIW